MSHKGSDFILVPWRDNFLERLLDVALEDCGERIDRAFFIFPNSRPEKYLALLLKHDPRIRRPLIMPRMSAVNALFSDLRGKVQSRPAWNAGLLDRVGLLLQCAREEAPLNGPDVADPERASLFVKDAGRFFPWGIRLAALFEECFSQDVKAENFHNLEGEVSPFAAALLSRLGNIRRRYVKGLEDREWTSPGRDAAVVMERLLEHGELPEGALGEGPVYIAGFHALTRAEDALFRHLWGKGARVLLHADPALAENNGRAHWSCEAFRTWAGAWKAGVRLLPSQAASDKPRRLRFYQGFDLHSQLGAMREELADLEDRGEKPAASRAGHPQSDESDRAADTVVVLPESGLLMPALHHLPRADVNISMGYPLARSPLFRLLDSIIRLQQNRRGKLYYWRDLLELIRHPYLKMLRPETGEEDGRDEYGPSLRIELHRLEQTLRGSAQRYANPISMLEETYQTMDAEDLPSGAALALLDRLFAVCLDGFEERRTPEALGKALEALCALLLDCGAHLWERFLIDAECLFRIMQSLIPELSRSILAQDAFPPESLLDLFRRLMQEERVPFEASPLVGLQVMGMLETRLLAFRRVLILETGEDSLPGSPVGDPLLPEALRPELGLPCLAAREQVSAYHFFRLLAGAEEIILLWQEGGDSPGIQEQKKKKSRFVEELLWNEEKKRGRLLSGNEEDSPLRFLTATLSPIPKGRKGIPVTQAVREAMLQLLAGPVSASLLDDYLRCPAQFYYSRLARLEPMEAASEGDDPIMVGNLFHRALQACYEPWLGKDLPGGEELRELLSEDMQAAFYGSPDYAALARSLPADSGLMLRKAGEKRIHDYLLAQPPTRVLSLERGLSAPFETPGRDFTLFGKADRIDLRLCEDDGGSEAGVHIIDYKTGRLPEIDKGLWEDDSFWESLQAWEAESPCALQPSLSPLRRLAEKMGSVQLPFYLLLYGLGDRGDGLPAVSEAPRCNAAWVELAAKGEEKALFSSKFTQFQNWDFIVTRGAIVVGFLLRHMLQAPELSPAPGEHCRWCFSAKLCIQAKDRQ